MKFKYKGYRIRASDKNLCIFVLFLAFLLGFLSSVIFCLSLDLIKYDFKNFSLLNFKVPFVLNLSFYVSIVISVIVGVGLIILVFLNKKYWIQVKHRQSLARMILDNGWYSKENVSDNGFFKDLGSKGNEKIIYWPCLYYRYEENHIYILIKITMGSSQEHFLKLDKKLETGLFCEFVEFNAKNPYYEYVFFTELEKSRISISDVVVQHGKIELMKGFEWKFDKLPHALIVGGTGSGKTYFILTLIKALAESEADLKICDPKNADLADLSVVLPYVYHIKDDIMACVKQFVEDMLICSEQMKQHPDYHTGCNYADLGFKPHFLIFDEYVAFIEMLDYKVSNVVMSNLKKIAMLGRQAGFFLILACQRPDAKYLADGIRDQFHLRLALGRNSELGYKMIFGDTDKHFLTMSAGRGYIDIGKNVISQFYSPFVPKGYDFIAEIRKLGLYKSLEVVVDDVANNFSYDKEVK